MENNKKTEYPGDDQEVEGVEPAEYRDYNDQVDLIDDPKSSKSKSILASILGASLIGLIGVAIWYFFLTGEEGKPVPAPRGVSFEDSDGDRLPVGEHKITLTDEQIAAANFKIVEIGETLDDVSTSSSTTGVVKANEYKETPVISLVGGVVKRIDVQLGQVVRRGQTIAVISSEELAQTQARYLSLKADLDEAEKRYKRALSLSNISEESRNELDKTASSLKAADAKLVETKSNFARSKKLVAIGAISQREFEKATTQLKIAEADLSEAKNRLDRATRLLKINPARNNEIDEFLKKVRNIQADVGSTREKLLVLGMPSERVGSLASSRQLSADLTLVSPISGSVTERVVNQGEIVSANSKIANITNLSTVWVIAQVYERDIGKLRIGRGASVTADSNPGKLFRGNIAYIDPNLDEKTRTAQVRIELANPGERLKIGMFVNVAFAGIGGSERTMPLVPKEAVQSIGNKNVVIMPTDDPKTFLIKPIKLAREKDDFYPATEGIFVGDRVVTDGSLLLRAEWLKTNSNEF